MFEQPLALALLLLAVPWLVWARRGAPRPWQVGGLEPFRGLPSAGGERRRWPPSLFLGLMGLACGVAALAGPRWRGAPLLRVEDHSLSSLGGWDLAAAPQRRVAGTVVVGAPDQPAAEGEILAALRVHGCGARTEIVTDRPAPRRAPAWLHWRSPWPQAMVSNAAILAAWTEDDGWHVHWAAWNLEGPLWLAVEGQPRLELEGAQGVAELGAVPPASLISLQASSGQAPDQRPADDVWRVPGPLALDLPPEADPRWRAAVQSALPEFTFQAQAGHRLPIRFVPDADAQSVFFPGDPFARQPELEAVAEIARGLAAWRARWGGAPRPRSECEPPGAPLSWPQDLTAVQPVAAGGRWLAAAGLLLYLAALALRSRGK
ncbi:MAG: hypothetical protein EYC70_04590 [Planctomycetota bacterium]|nr:MAG: hypothetical protein EYC70_04590 [Planctomycetota bacterium]